MKKKKFIATLPLLLACLCASAQDADTTKLWDINGYGSANFNQVSFTNWAAGGDNAISFSLIAFFQAKYAKNRHNWDNTANLLYGMIRTKEFGLRKNEDRIELESKYGYILNKKKTLNASLLGNFKSQFAEGFNFPNDSVVVSKFAAPGYLMIAAGIDWKPVKYFSLFVSPATGKITFIRDQPIANTGMYGNKPAVTDSLGNIITEGESVRYQFGAYLNAQFNKEVVKNVTIISRLDLFSNYTGDTKASKMVDVNWENALLFKINEWLAASLTLHMIYDKEILIPKELSDGTIEMDDRFQLKQALSIGLTYKFDNKKKKSE